MSFFSIFSRKNYCLMPIYIFKNKNVHSLITHYSHANILSKKRPFSQKHCALMSIKKKIMKNPLLSCLYLITKRQFCQNNTILWAKEVSRMPIFCDFSRKNYRSYAHILWKNVHSLKNTLLSSLYFVKKTSILSKNTVLLCHFFKIFMKKTLLSRPYLVKKRQFSRVARLLNFGK